MSAVWPMLITLVLFLAYSAWLQYLATQERRELHHRLMAKSLPEYLQSAMPPSPSAVVGAPGHGHVVDPDYPYDAASPLEAISEDDGV